MLSMFEKLINEHGSSTILKERILLINDKYEVLQTKLDLSEKENSLLKTSNEELKNKLKEYESKFSAQSLQAEQLPDVQINLLKILFKNTDGIDEKVLAHELNIDELWDSMAIVKYPSRQVLLNMTSSDEFLELSIHRDAGLAGQLNIESRIPE